MPKSDKELAVELAKTYISAWAARPEPLSPMTQEAMDKIVLTAYNSIHKIPNA